MAILVTGGTGFIGSHTVVELLNAGREVIIVDNFSNSKPVVLDRIKQITGKTCKLYEADLLNYDAIENIFKENQIDAAIHFAGLKAVGESVAQPLRYYHNNITGTLNLLDIMSKYGAKCIVFSSSATVYSPDNAMPVKESARTGGCTNPYGWTKYMSEQILTDTARADPDWTVMLLRYFNPVGAHPSGLIGEDPRGVPNNLMPYISQTAAGRREKLSVFGNDYPTPDGTGVRDYLHVVDLARGHVAAMDYMAGHPGVHVFNLGTGRGYSVLEMVHAFEAATGKRVPYVIAPRRAGDVAEVYCDPAKAERELGWKAEYSLEDMCRDSWNWQSKNPNGFAAD